MAAALIHVIEEYTQGFLGWVPRVSGVRMGTPLFVVINMLFVALCMLVALPPRRSPVLELSVPGLILVNALLHAGASVRFRRRVPGLVSALLLYVPLGIAAFTIALRTGAITVAQAGWALLLGAGWHLVPWVLVATRVLRARRAT